jgi:hypothetical protein
MIENEHLRQMLYYNQTSETNVFANQIVNQLNITKGVIRQKIKDVASKHHINEKDLYNHMYRIATNIYFVELPKHTNESKLTQYWRAGALPLLYMIVDLYDNVAWSFKTAQKIPKSQGKTITKF